jgi:hypothetical protein
MEAAIARRLAVLDTLNERLKHAAYARHHILRDLAMDRTVFMHGLSDTGKFGLLLIIGDTAAAHTPRFPPLANGSVVDMATGISTRSSSCSCCGVGLSLYLKVLRTVCSAIAPYLPNALCT